MNIELKRAKKREYQKQYMIKIKSDPVLFAQYQIKKMADNKKIWENRKNDPKFIENRKKRQIAYYNRNKGSIAYRFSTLKTMAKEDGVNNHITKDQLENLLNTSYCYITGIKLSDHLKDTSKAYYLDRIGKPEFGGNGLGGGDYHIDNVLPCIFKFNYAREILGFTPEQMKLLFIPLKLVIKYKTIKNKVLKFLGVKNV